MYPTATPFKKIHCSCACSGFFSAYFGFEGYRIWLPFNRYQITEFTAQNTETPIITAQTGKNTQNGIERMNGNCRIIRITCRNIDQIFLADG